MKLKLIYTLTLLFLLAVPALTKAQTPTLTGKKWIVAEYGISDNLQYGLDPKVKPLVVFFHKDSANNKVDYSNIEMRFFANTTYEAKNILGVVYSGKWNLNAAGDSLTTDSLTYKFNFINNTNCITNNATMQVVDTLGTVDTLYSYIKLYGVPDISGIDELTSSAFNIYPVPANDQVTIQFPSKNFKEVRLYNIFGQLIRTETFLNKQNQLTLNVQKLVSGCYLLEITGNDGSKMVKKIIKE